MIYYFFRFISFTSMARHESHESYRNLTSQQSKKHVHPAAERNKDPILQTLKEYINTSKSGKLLEISSGSGQHVAHIAPNFPNITFQPTEMEEQSISSIEAYRNDNTTRNIEHPQKLDARQPVNTWLNGSLEKNSIDYMLNINLIHISEWACAEGLFNGSGYLLKSGGYLFTYGPYAVDGQITPDSNVKFQEYLRSSNPNWGLRDIVRELIPLAKRCGLQLFKQHELPANNKLLVWKKD